MSFAAWMLVLPFAEVLAITAAWALMSLPAFRLRLPGKLSGELPGKLPGVNAPALPKPTTYTPASLSICVRVKSRPTGWPMA